MMLEVSHMLLSKMASSYRRLLSTPNQGGRFLLATLALSWAAPCHTTSHRVLLLGCSSREAVAVSGRMPSGMPSGVRPHGSGCSAYLAATCRG